MTRKWVPFLLGLLSGLILAGLFYLLFVRDQASEQIILLDSTAIASIGQSTQQAVQSNQGKININSASIEELSTLPGIGPAKASAIIQYREKYGQFQNIEELLYVPGFGESVYSSIQDLITTE
jgi:competence protein ComEA